MDDYMDHREYGERRGSGLFGNFVASMVGAGLGYAIAYLIINRKDLKIGNYIDKFVRRGEKDFGARGGDFRDDALGENYGPGYGGGNDKDI